MVQTSHAKHQIFAPKTNAVLTRARKLLKLLLWETNKNVQGMPLTEGTLNFTQLEIVFALLLTNRLINYASNLISSYLTVVFSFFCSWYHWQDWVSKS